MANDEVKITVTAIVATHANIYSEYILALGCLKGLEPSIFGATTRRFNLLSYRHHESF